MKPRPSRRIVIVSDLHVNSTVGLWPPGMTDLDHTPRPQSDRQAFLWGCWLDFCKAAQKSKDYIVVVNGDAVQGIHPNKDSQLITTSASTMRYAAKKVLKPLTDHAKKTYFVRGTEFHDATGGGDIEEIAQDLGAAIDDETGQYSRWDLWLELNKKLFYFTHHIGFYAVYPLTAPQQEMRKAKENVVDLGYPMPDAIVRSHRHQYSKLEDGNGHFLFVTPSWQLKVAYVFKRVPQAVNDIGGLMLWVEDGAIRYEAKRYRLPTPHIERCG